MKPALFPCLVSLALVGSAQATPSGLNNIPTADTAAQGDLVVQVFDLFGDGPHDLGTGFKTGWDLPWFDLEWGLDSHVAPDPAGPLFFQTKIAFNPWKDGAIALGVAGVALSDLDAAGDPFSYAVLSQDVGFARLHAGYGLQTGGNTVLLGIDRNVDLFASEVNLNADLVQTRDGRGWMPSVGCKFELCRNVVFESWTTFPDEGSVELMLKLNFVIPLDSLTPQLVSPKK